MSIFDNAHVITIEPTPEDLEGGIVFSDMRAAGFLPGFFSVHDERPAYEQLVANYPFGSDFDGFKLTGSGTHDWALRYPGDPPLNVVSFAMLRGEALVLFEYSWLAIIQPDGAFVVHRVD